MAINATETALNSAGSAQKEFTTALDSIDKRLEGIAGSFTQLVTDGGLTDFIKLILTATQGLLNFANSGVGQFIIQVGFLTTGYALLTSTISILSSTGFAHLIKDLIAINKGQITVLNSTLALNLANKGLIGTLKILNTTLSTSPFVIATTVVVGIKAMIFFFDLLNESVEENQKKLKENQEKLANLKSEYGDITNNVKSLITELDNVNEKIKEINATDGIQVANDELSELYQERIELENILAVEQERARLAQIKYDEQAKKTVYTTFKSNYITNNEETLKTGLVQYEDVTSVEELEFVSEQMKYYNRTIEEGTSKLAEYDKQIEKGFPLTLKQASEYDRISNSISKTNIKYNDASSYASGLAEALMEGITYSSEDSEARKYAQSALDAYSEALKSNTDVQSDNSNSVKQSIENQELADEKYKNSISNLSDMTDNFSSLNDVISDYNANNGYSLQNIEDLLDMGVEYISLLDEENGKLSINEDRAFALANAKIDLAQAQAIEKAGTDLASIAMDNYSTQLDEVSDSSNSVINNVSLAGKSAYTSGLNAREGGKGWEYYWERQNPNNIGLYSDNQIDAMQSVQDNLVIQLNSLETLRNSLGSYTTATNNATDATNDYNDALQDEIDKYDIVIDYVKDKIKEEQSAIEEEKDVALNAIQDKIDALENEQDAWEINIDNKIDILEKEKDAFNEIKDVEIKSLEERIEAENEYWDKQIDDYNNANDVIEKNIELQKLQEVLARAKSSKVMVLKDGKFVYTENQVDVSQAEEDLANYEREISIENHLQKLEDLKDDALNSLQNQLEKLEDFVTDTNAEYDKQVEDLKALKDNKKQSYDEQLEDLKKYYDDVELEFDNSIEKYNDYNTQFEDMLSASADKQAEILANELLGEQNNWEDRLSALSKFVSEYEKKKKQLDVINSNNSTPSYSNTSTPTTNTNNHDVDIKDIKAPSMPSLENSNNIGNADILRAEQYYKDFIEYIKNIKEYNKLTNSNIKIQKPEYITWYNRGGTPNFTDVWKEYNSYAKGSYGIKEDEIAFVGDSPNRETLIGAKYNKSMGIPMNLQKGTGILPAKDTKTFASLMSNISRENSYSQISNNNGNSQNITIDKMIIEGVQNANDFAKELSLKFRNIAMQKSY